MEILWYFLDGELEQGPMTFEELVRALEGLQDPRSVYVWNEEMEDWAEAGAVAEVRERLPLPPPPAVPSPAATRPAFVPASEPVRYVTIQEVEAVAKLYRRLVLLFGAQVFLSVLLVAVGSAVPEDLLVVPALAILPLIGIVFCGMFVTIHHLAERLGSRFPMAWAALLFFPLGNLAALAALSARATAWCVRHGLKVGLLGPVPESVEDLRRRVSGSTFA